MRFQVQGDVCFFLKSMWAAKLWDCYVIKLLLAGREEKRRRVFFLTFCLSVVLLCFLSLSPHGHWFPLCFLFYFFKWGGCVCVCGGGGCPNDSCSCGMNSRNGCQRSDRPSRPGLSRSSCKRCVVHSVRVWVLLWICGFLFRLCSHLRFGLLFLFFISPGCFQICLSLLLLPLFPANWG